MTTERWVAIDFKQAELKVLYECLWPSYVQAFELSCASPPAALTAFLKVSNALLDLDQGD